MTAGCFLVLFAALAWYIFQTGSLIAVNQTVKLTEMEIEKIKTERLALRSDSASQLSLENIEQKLARLNFVPLGPVKYIPLPALLLAARTNQ